MHMLRWCWWTSSGPVPCGTVAGFPNRISTGVLESPRLCASPFFHSVSPAAPALHLPPRRGTVPYNAYNAYNAYDAECCGITSLYLHPPSLKAAVASWLHH